MRYMFAKWLIMTAIVMATSFLAITVALPYGTMGLGLARVERGDAVSPRARGATGKNKIYHSQVVDERYGPDSNYLFTRPNPDILYSACSYDLDAGPVLVGMSNHPEYGSIAFHRDNTDNYDVTNNRGVTAPRLDVLIIQKGGPAPEGYQGKIVESPTRTGMALIRLLMERRQDLPRYLALQQQHSCALYKGNRP